MLFAISYTMIWWLLFYIFLPIARYDYKKGTGIKIKLKILVVSIVSVPVTHIFMYYFDDFIYKIIFNF